MDETIFNRQEKIKNAWSNFNQNAILKQVSAHNNIFYHWSNFKNTRGAIHKEKYGYLNT